MGKPEGRLGHPGGRLGHPGGRLGHPGGRLGHPGGRLGHPGGRLLIVGLDGAGWKYISSLIEEGHMPFLSRVLRDGCSAPLLSTIPPISPAAWVSFSTGLTPGEHGVFSFYRRPDYAKSYQRRPIPSGYWSDLSVWRRLAEQDEAVVLLNVPMAYPPLDLPGGVCVSGLGSPGDDPRCLTSPQWVGEELVRAVPGYIVDVSTIQGTFRRRKLVETAEKMVETRLHAALWLMQRVPWKVFFVVFTAPDRLEHELWKFHDPGHPGYCDPGFEQFRDVVPRLYRSLDSALAQLAGRLEPHDTVLGLSDHGFGPLVKEFYVNRWLEQQGWLHFLPGWRDPRLVAEGAAGQISAPGVFVDSVDWSKTRAYSMGHLGEIYLNLSGREPEGIVQAGNDAESVLGELETALFGLTDPEDGKPLCDWVKRGSELFSGERSGESPDLLFSMREYRVKGYMTGRALEFQDTTRPLLCPVLPAGRSGEHREEGLAFSLGMDQEKFVSGPMRIWELGQRVAGWAGIEYTGAVTDADGKKRGHVRDEKEYTSEEEKIIRERLRRLGYLE